MDSPKLATLFHVNENEWNTVYKMLFESPLTHHLDIEIKQYKSSIGFPAFFYYTEEMTSILTQLIKEASNLAEITGELPNIALTHFTKSCLIEEIQSTNEIEGVSSSRKEITAAIEDQSNIENKNTTRLWGIVNKYLKLQSQDNIAFKTSQDLRNFYDDFVLDEVCREDPNDKPDGKIFRAGSVDVLSRTNTVNSCIFPVLIARVVHFIYVSLSAIRSITFRSNRVHCYPIATHCHPVTALTPCLLFLSHTGAPCLPSLSAMCGRTCGTPRLL